MKVLFIIAALALTVGCSSPQRPKGQTEAEVLYKEALELKENGKYLLATEKLNVIKSEYPYSYFATSAELLQADILFEQKLFIEATSAYLLFKDLHPKHEKIDYVLWKTAESFYNQIPSTYDRDLTAASMAMRYYDELITKFPSTQYLAEAKKKMEGSQELLENKEKYIADFYFKTKVYNSAIFRYKEILNSGATPALQEHARLRIIESFYRLLDRNSCLAHVELYLGALEGNARERVLSLKERCEGMDAHDEL